MMARPAAFLALLAVAACTTGGKTPTAIYAGNQAFEDAFCSGNAGGALKLAQEAPATVTPLLSGLVYEHKGDFIPAMHAYNNAAAQLGRGKSGERVHIQCGDEILASGDSLHAAIGASDRVLDKISSDKQKQKAEAPAAAKPEKEMADSSEPAMMDQAPAMILPKPQSQEPKPAMALPNVPDPLPKPAPPRKRDGNEKRAENPRTSQTVVPIDVALPASLDPLGNYFIHLTTHNTPGWSKRGIAALAELYPALTDYLEARRIDKPGGTIWRLGMQIADKADGRAFCRMMRRYDQYCMVLRAG